MIFCHRFELSLHAPLVMGIVNVTDDSFSGDGLGHNIRKTIDYAYQQCQEGASILDVGAESTRPGSIRLPEEEEWKRLSPVLDEVIRWQIPISVDTYKPAIMIKALDCGADLINDINGFRLPGAWKALSASSAAGIIMHMKGTPTTMQEHPQYSNVFTEVTQFLHDQANEAKAWGINRRRLIFDPGFGFGKTLEHNRALFTGLRHWPKALQPLLIGVSRKSMLGAIIQRQHTTPKERLVASIAAATMACSWNAKILRVHDVLATVDALKVWNTLQPQEPACVHQ